MIKCSDKCINNQKEREIYDLFFEPLGRYEYFDEVEVRKYIYRECYYHAWAKSTAVSLFCATINENDHFRVIFYLEEKFFIDDD